MGLLLCSGSAECMEWVSLPCANTPPRNSHAAVLDGETMVVVGGASPEGQTDEVFAIDLSNRSDLTCRSVSCQPLELKTGEAHNSEGFGAVPTAREMHSACAYNSQGAEGTGATILVMGGRSAAGVLRDLFSLDTGARRGDSLSWHHKLSRVCSTRKYGLLVIVSYTFEVFRWRPSCRPLSGYRAIHHRVDTASTPTVLSYCLSHSGSHPMQRGRRADPDSTKNSCCFPVFPAFRGEQIPGLGGD